MVPGSENLKIPKLKIMVRLQLVSGEWLSGNIFLSPATQEHPGSERISDLLLHGDDLYIPLNTEDDCTILVCKKNISLVEMNRDTGLGEFAPFRELLKSASRIPVKLTLVSKCTLEGEALILPQGSEQLRLLDWLNKNRFFLPVLGENTFVYVTQNSIATVEESKT